MTDVLDCSVLQNHGCETESMRSKLTLVAVPAKALELVLGGGHAGATVLTRPAVAWAAINTLTDGPALRKCVGQVDLLPINRHLKTKADQE